MGIQQAVREFFSFLRFPIFDYKREAPLSFGMVTKLFFIVFALEMLLFAPISLLLGLEEMPHAMQEVMDKFASWKVFVLAVILAPIAEEFIFRFHLRYKSLIFLFFLIVIVTMVGLGLGPFGEAKEVLGLVQAQGVENIQMDDVKMEKMKPAFMLLSIIPFLFIAYFMSDKVKSIARGLTRGGFPMIFYWTAVVFAFVHVFNFQLDPDKWYIAPLLVFPQFFLALYLGYVRVRNNIFYSIYVHALNNSIPMALFTIAGVQ